MIRVYLAGFALLAFSLAPAARAATETARWGTPGSSAGELHAPFAVAVHRDRVYVTDFDNDRVQAFTRDGAFLFGWGASGSADGQFHGPAGLAIDADGSILVADHYNHRIQRFTAEGRFLGGFAAGGAGAAPIGIAVDRNGRIYATDLDAGRVRVWSSDGKPLGEWGDLREPWGIAVDPRGDVWVSEHGRDRLVGFTPDGRALKAPAPLGTPLVGPMAIAVDQGGRFFVSDLRGGNLGPLDRSPVTGIAVEPSGLAWAADPDRHEIARFLPDASSDVPARASTRSTTPLLQLALSSVSRGSVHLRVTIASRGTLSVQVFSPAGRLVWSAPRSDSSPGEHVVTWNGRTSAGPPASTGVYFVRVQLDTGAERMERTDRVVLIR